MYKYVRRMQRRRRQRWKHAKSGYDQFAEEAAEGIYKKRKKEKSRAHFIAKHTIDCNNITVSKNEILLFIPSSFSSSRSLDFKEQ